ncbi:type II toxin-antitoxin system mRNA interferase toxin, RelE/StbE family [Helicobacter saguini]|uniref:Type II toxin-antitoxin system YafQ family toxin n=1 Tax=Helicobacter saguini TaxID=1548018 RepID=A0A347VSK6_9HELI|nr:type II toxin-antitoxin system YafQ family toxin [Helicobacter saguini]MWV62467.1 type II toxin-antitoxin system mRNA interferase toxin, RelE/StbE family [Helicobacter saguini]MWV66860.1 type II toxin-antitoxin system mRNA interferase toxin, RelE/StbE family [Helicobacter saguini]MWV69209.1 type II toxin-antitoxin system mRNA interferase toxin, RelE/StbE family [Helicobacter saguini]MWV71236.1 type II toxin-antitoxin system mRNA interferase toxin, RelE/StbE family [Helicobacter saguini]TLD9
MYKFEPSNRFKRQYKKLNQNDKDKAKEVINKLLNGEILESKYKDHKLSGEYSGFRECHIKPDLLLIYKKDSINLILICLDIGSHSDLF